MKAPEGEKKRQLVSVLKNGMAFFTEASERELGIYCQNVFIDEVFTIEKSLKIKEKTGGRSVSVRCSSDAKKITVLVSAEFDERYNPRRLPVRPVDVNFDEVKPILYTITIDDLWVIAGIEKEVLTENHDCIRHISDNFGTIFPNMFSGYSLFDYIAWTISSREYPRTVMDRFLGNYKELQQNCVYIFDAQSREMIVDHVFSTNSSRSCLSSSNINGVALSPNKKFFAISQSDGEYVLLNRCCTGKETGEIIIYTRDPEIKELKHFNLLDKCGLYGSTERYKRKEKGYHTKDLKSSILSMAISDIGTVAIAFLSPGNYVYIYFYSLSQNESSYLPQLDIKYSHSDDFFPAEGHFLEEEKYFIFRLSSQSWMMCERVANESFEWKLVKKRDVDTFEIPPPSVEKESKTTDSKKELRKKTVPQQNFEPVQLNSRRLAVKANTPEKVPSSSEVSSDAIITSRSNQISVISEQVREEPLSNVPREEPRFIEYGELKEQKKIKENDTHIIYTASWKAKVVALKVIKTAGDSETNKKCLEREFNTLRNISHQRIIRTFGYSLGVSNNFCLVLQYYPNGDLGKYIFNPIKWSNPKVWRYRCMLEISEGVNYLHSQNPPLIHLDIKPENIFLDENWHAVIGDFGLSIVLPRNNSHQSTDSGGKGTVEFMAPELHQIPNEGQRNAYTPFCDIYSLAVLMWCCEFQKRPFNDLSVFQVPVKVTQGGREKIPTEASPKIAALIQFCWKQKPHDRPKVSDVLREMTDIYKEELRNAAGKVSGPRSLRK